MQEDILEGKCLVHIGLNEACVWRPLLTGMHCESTRKHKSVAVSELLALKTVHFHWFGGNNASTVNIHQ